MLKQILKFKEAILYLGLIFFGFVYLLMQIVPQVTELIRTEQKIKKRTVDLEKATEKLEKIRKEAQESKKNKAERLKQIYKPEIKFDKSDTDYLIMAEDIVGMIKDNGIKIYALDYNYEVSSDEIVSQSGGKYLACQLTFSLIGNFEQIKRLIMDLIQYPYLITINSIEVEPYQKNKKVLLSVLKMTIYSEQ